jgi:hypothetical protein
MGNEKALEELSLLNQLDGRVANKTDDLVDTLAKQND